MDQRFQYIMYRLNAIRAQLEVCRTDFNNILALPIVGEFQYNWADFNHLEELNLDAPEDQWPYLLANGMHTVIHPYQLPTERVYYLTSAQPIGQPGQWQLEEQEPGRIIYIRETDDGYPRGLYRIQNPNLPDIWNLINGPEQLDQVELEPLLTFDNQQAIVPENGWVYFLDQQQRQTNQQLLDDNQLRHRIGNIQVILYSAQDELNHIWLLSQQFNVHDEMNMRNQSMAWVQLLADLAGQFFDLFHFLEIIQVYQANNVIQNAIRLEIPPTPGLPGYRLA